MHNRIVRGVLVLSFLVLLGGCFLQAAREETLVPIDTGGMEHQITFYRSDTTGEWVQQAIDLGTSAQMVEVNVFAQVKEGDLEVQILEANDDREAFTVKADADGEQAGQVVRTDDVGNLQYRVRALNAFNGSYTIRYTPPPTPTPTPTPLPTATSTPTPLPTATPLPATPTAATVVPTP